MCLYKYSHNTWSWWDSLETGHRFDSSTLLFLQLKVLVSCSVWCCTNRINSISTHGVAYHSFYKCIYQYLYATGEFCYTCSDPYNSLEVILVMLPWHCHGNTNVSQQRVCFQCMVPPAISVETRSTLDKVNINSSHTPLSW